MTRVKWLKVSDGFGRGRVKELAKALSEKSYSDEKSLGFIVDELRNDYLKSRYISKRVVKQKIETPFGECFDQELISYDTTKFIISSTGPGLELIDPPRSTSEYFNQLSLSSNFQISFSEISVDIKAWLKNITVKDGCVVVLKSFECKEIKLGESLRGTLVVSGAGNIEDEIRSLLGKRVYSLKRVKMAVNGCDVTISSNCSAQIGYGDYESIVRLLRDSIP